MNRCFLSFTVFFLFIGQSFSQDIQYQPVTLNFDVESTSETSGTNPFTEYKLNVTFSSGVMTFNVPGFYAADGNAGETGANSGGTWRVIFTPPLEGDWTYEVSFKSGTNIAISEDAYAGKSIKPHDGKRGKIAISQLSAGATLFAKSGRLAYKNSRYLHTEDGNPLLKLGTNSPENFLAYGDIDGTYSYDPDKQFLKSWSAHAKDWKEGDPTWQNGKGKGIIGALNYLASEGMNVVYALTMNIEGDARDVWPYLSHERKDFLRFDVSKLAQWDIIFTHAEDLGIIMNLVTQEKENELILDDGNTGIERKLYYRELIARFAHHKNIIWNMGEENGPAPNFWPQGQSDQQRFAMIRYVKDHDPYQNPLVIHTMSEENERKHILNPLLGFDRLDGFSMQISNVFDIHKYIKLWIGNAEKMNRSYIVMMDEIGPWHTGARTDKEDPAHDTLRQEVLWGTLMAGGAGVEWYFGWFTPPNDLNGQDWRSRENLWKQSKVAHEFFKTIPYTEMMSTDELLKNDQNYCFSKPGEIYVVYVKKGGTEALDLRGIKGNFEVQWLDPVAGGALKEGSITTIKGGGWTDIGTADGFTGPDKVALIRKK